MLCRPTILNGAKNYYSSKNIVTKEQDAPITRPQKLSSKLDEHEKAKRDPCLKQCFATAALDVTTRL